MPVSVFAKVLQMIEHSRRLAYRLGTFSKWEHSNVNPCSCGDTAQVPNKPRLGVAQPVNLPSFHLRLVPSHVYSMTWLPEIQPR